MITRRFFVSASLAAALLAATGPALADRDPIYGSLFGNVAINGYDPVAYFRQGRPVEGSADHTATWKGKVWRFASAENRDAFAAAPETYAPQYGGYCAWAVAEGYTASTDPAAWRIVDDKLYLNYSKSVQARWSRDIPGNIERADANWPKVLED